MLLLAALLFQTTDAAILGRVTDTAARPIDAATVTARNSSTGVGTIAMSTTERVPSWSI